LIFDIIESDNEDLIGVLYKGKDESAAS